MTVNDATRDTPALEIFEREFLPMRAKLLETAAALDRIDRAEGSVETDPRLDKLHRALEVLASSDPDRAEQLQLIFSLPYDKQWRGRFFG